MVTCCRSACGELHHGAAWAESMNCSRLSQSQAFVPRRFQDSYALDKAQTGSCKVYSVVIYIPKPFSSHTGNQCINSSISKLFAREGILLSDAAGSDRTISYRQSIKGSESCELSVRPTGRCVPGKMLHFECLEHLAGKLLLWSGCSEGILGSWGYWCYSREVLGGK